MKILLVDDRHLIRSGLVGAFEELAPGGTVLEASDGTDAWRRVEANGDLPLAVLDLAEPTVKHHVSAILRALNVSNRTEAAMAVADRRPTSPKIG